jgi:hypothetical protein
VQKPADKIACFPYLSSKIWYNSNDAIFYRTKPCQ